MRTFKILPVFFMLGLPASPAVFAQTQQDQTIKMTYSAIDKENVPIEKLQIACPVLLAPLIDARLNKETIGAPFFGKSALVGPIESWMKDGLSELKTYGASISPSGSVATPAGKEIAMEVKITRAYTWQVGLKIFSTITTKMKYISAGGAIQEKSYRVLGDKTNMWGAQSELVTTLNYGLNNLLPTLAFDLQVVCNGGKLSAYSFVQPGTKPTAATATQTAAQVSRPITTPATAATTAVLAKTPADGYSRLPYISDQGQTVFREYLGLPSPKAFAISKTGVWRYAHLYTDKIPNRSADPKLRAIENCQEVAKTDCILYAIENDVVFRKNATPEELAMLDALSKAEAVPYLNERGRDNYRLWLTRPLPRAFAVAANGYSWGAFGPKPADPNLPTDIAERALKACESNAASECKIYAIDERVVWPK
jgi:hypothetical protein